MTWDQFLEGFYSAGMAILDFVFNVILTLILAFTYVIVLPFALLVQTFLPQINDMLLYVSNFFNFAEIILGRIIDIALIFIPQPVMTAAMALIAAQIFVPITLWAIKLAIAWFTKLK